jgi:hypothetical protein
VRAVKTPGHAVINLAVLGGQLSPGDAGAVLAGAVVPDLPIVVLYVRERWLRRTPEERIWADHYQRPFWQAVIHGAHSIPLGLAGLAASLAVGAPRAAAFFASAALHALCDLPVHAEDAHRHFLPLSSYRWKSPLSYWDVRYHARYVALAELALVLGASVAVWREGPAAAALLLVGAWYVGDYVRTFLLRPAGDGASS